MEKGCNHMVGRDLHDLGPIPRPELPRAGAILPPEHQAILDRRVAPNGLAYREIKCVRCGYHLGDDGILIGCYRKKCPKCKFPNEVEINRVGEAQELEEFYANAPAVRIREGG